MDLNFMKVCNSMNTQKVSAILYYTAAILFDSAAIISFIGGTNGVMWLCFGSMFLCLGAHFKKSVSRIIVVNVEPEISVGNKSYIHG